MALQSSTIEAPAVEAEAPMLNKRPAVFVGNIPFVVTAEELESQVRNRLGESFDNCVLVMDKRTGRSKGFAYVNVLEDKVDDAISHLQGIELNGRTLVIDIRDEERLVSRFLQDGKTPRGVDFGARPKRDFSEVNERTVYVGNLDSEWTRDEFQAFVADAVNTDVVKGVRLAVFSDTQKCKGFGHIEFESKEAAQQVVENLQRVDVRGRNLIVSMAGTKTERRSSDNRFNSADGSSASNRMAAKHTVFVGNLSWKVTQEIMEQMLTDVVGENTFRSVRIGVDRETGRSRGFAHVEFHSAELAQSAINNLNGLEVLGRRLRADPSDRDRGFNNKSNNMSNNDNDSLYSSDNNSNDQSANEESSFASSD
jgi:RNA recognition motif-containing protein